MKNNSEYQKEYMQKYIQNAKDVTCEVCGTKYKSYRKYKHEKSRKHMTKVEKSKISLDENEIKLIKRMLNKKQARDDFDSDQNGYDGWKSE